ncbi:MAG: hypothetical protein M3Y33_05195 [Actinomycetota bacterium]|nr:hypothetical protein [Actinomycetota bacterium]
MGLHDRRVRLSVVLAVRSLAALAYAVVSSAVIPAVPTLQRSPLEPGAQEQLAPRPASYVLAAGRGRHLTGYGPRPGLLRACAGTLRL